MTEPLLHAVQGSTAAAEPAPADEHVCWLLGYLPEAEALLALSGGRYGVGPYPLELQQQVAAARAAVANRPVFTAPPAVVPHAEDHGVLADLAARNDIQAAFAGASWQPRFVDLRNVIALQKLVVTDGLDERVAAAVADRAQVVELCMPSANQQVQVDFSKDSGDRAFTFSSLSPNLRLQAVQGGLGPSGTSLTCHLGFGSPFLNVVQLGDRYFLRDGSHRAVGLLRHDVTVVPAIVITGTSAADLTVNPDLFTTDITLGDRPPLVADFLDERVTAPATRRPMRKVVRIRTDEFFIVR